VIAACSSDRTIFLLDSRQKVPLTKVVLKLRSNSISWNPLEPFTFVCANEDYKLVFPARLQIIVNMLFSLYTFDMRYLDSAKNVHQGHTAAVIAVDYAPTGQEFVSGSYDRSLRIFPADSWRSR